MRKIYVSAPFETVFWNGLDDCQRFKWTPFMEGNMVGYIVTRLSDGKTTHIYMNPSTSGEGDPDVFIYAGKSSDPARDVAVCFITPDFEEE
jgi:hypothetical protein